MLLDGRIVLISAIVPLAAAVVANRTTSLIYATGWAVAAWAGWVLAALAGADAFGYLALALTGCAGVAVFGARRPGAAAWTFVVAGLLVVLFLPWAESVANGAPVQFGRIRAAFLIGLLVATVINYLPTGMALAAILIAAGCACELARLFARWPADDFPAFYIGTAAWVGWACVRLGPRAPQRRPISECDRLWRRFRDCYGFIWAERLREQFNRAAANADLRGRMAWSGLRGECNAAAYEILAALVKRFIG
jgi:hypothetical protein